MEVNDAYAFNDLLQPYRHGRQARLPQRVIAHAGIMPIDIYRYQDDQTLAGQSWTVAERTVADVPRASLALVIGELIPEAAIQEPCPGGVAFPPTYRAFNPAVHTFVPTQPVRRVVVARLEDEDLHFYVLVGKFDGNGTSCLTRIPHHGEPNHTVFFYNEWVSPYPDDANLASRYLNI